MPHQLALVPTTGNKAWLEGGTRRGASGSPWQSPAIVYGTECILRLCNLTIVRARKFDLSAAQFENKVKESSDCLQEALMCLHQRYV